jgi:hypothetical protein
MATAFIILEMLLLSIGYEGVNHRPPKRIAGKLHFNFILSLSSSTILVSRQWAVILGSCMLKQSLHHKSHYHPFFLFVLLFFVVDNSNNSIVPYFRVNKTWLLFTQSLTKSVKRAILLSLPKKHTVYLN